MAKYFPGLLFLLTITSSTFGQTESIGNILKRTDSAQHAIKRATYSAIYSDDYSATDKISSLSGKCYIDRVPEDTIFGCKFKIEYFEHGVDVSYYYDRKKTYLVNRLDKKIIFQDVHKYPVEARKVVAVLFLPKELGVKNLFKFFRKLGGKISFGGIDSASIVVDVSFPTAANGYQRFEKIYIDSSTCLINKIHNLGIWRGTKYQSEIIFTDFQIHQQDELKNLKDSLNIPGFAFEDFTQMIMDMHREALLATGQIAPDFSMVSFGKKQMKLSALKGNYVLLDFWEPWCGWCIEKFPILEDLSAKYAGKKFYLLALNSEMKDRAKQIIKNGSYKLNCHTVDTSVVTLYKVIARPTYYLIGPEGNILIAGHSEDLLKIGAVLKSKLD